MKPSYKVALGIFLAGSFACVLTYLLRDSTFSVLFPSGAIGIAERDLMIHATELMLIVAIPVFILAIFIAWHYRASNEQATYKPNWEHSKMEELIWWSIPFEIVLVLAALTWTSTHELDPSKALTISGEPLTVQVVALEWKWLFIYPDQHIASVNELVLPTGRPIAFHITADAPMNSFWIPALGGQMYAMTGMTTKLHLVADKSGTYAGSSANYSGEGFPQMKFAVKAVPEEEFDAWVVQTEQLPTVLDMPSYTALAEPSEAGPARYYGVVSKNLFEEIIALFMTAPDSSVHHH
jgi:cytochrome o ubiquinol oxidase subunit 2